MLDEILKRDKLLLRDKSDEKELGLQGSKKSLNLGLEMIVMLVENKVCS